MRVDQLLVGHRLDVLALVVELEDRHTSALAIDDAQIADDARQQLRLARVDQVGDLAARELPHFALALVEQMAGQVEAERRLLQRQPLLDAPGLGLHQRRVRSTAAQVAGDGLESIR